MIHASEICWTSRPDGAAGPDRGADVLGDDLDDEQKQRHPAEVIPDRMAMNRNFFLVGELCDRADRQTLVKPGCQGFDSHDLSLTTEDTEEDND